MEGTINVQQMNDWQMIGNIQNLKFQAKQVIGNQTRIWKSGNIGKQNFMYARVRKQEKQHPFSDFKTEMDLWRIHFDIWQN